jgi:HTH-type transcriptional regulator/antitoxin HigA
MMITNEKQYRSSNVMLEKFVDALEATSQQDVDLSPILLEAHKNAILSQISELEEEIQHYQLLVSGKITEFEACGLKDLPDILIQARIARGMSQKDLGDFLGIKEQQVQRYEADRYRSTSLTRLIEVADALDVTIVERAALVGGNSLEEVDPASWQNFPVPEMFKRGWFEDFSGTLANARKEAPELIPAFIINSGSVSSELVFHRKSVRASGQVHEPAILAWEARVRYLALQDPPEASFDPKLATDDWLRGLVALTLDGDGPQLVVEHLRNIGISLVVEPQLPGTLIDGAAILADVDHVIIALTLRHDRLDNFWFTLFHEIGHVILHIATGQFSSIFDETEAPSENKEELEADLFAQEALLPSDTWAKSVARFSQNEKSVMIDVKRFGVGPSVIAGRIRRETGDYTLLPKLIGQRGVRKFFEL